MHKCLCVCKCVCMCVCVCAVQNLKRFVYFLGYTCVRWKCILCPDSHSNSLVQAFFYFNHSVVTRGAQFNRLWRLINCLLRIDSQLRVEMSNRLIVQ